LVGPRWSLAVQVGPPRPAPGRPAAGRRRRWRSQSAPTGAHARTAWCPPGLEGRAACGPGLPTAVTGLACRSGLPTRRAARHPGLRQGGYRHLSLRSDLPLTTRCWWPYGRPPEADIGVAP